MHDQKVIMFILCLFPIIDVINVEMKMKKNVKKRKKRGENKKKRL